MGFFSTLLGAGGALGGSFLGIPPTVGFAAGAGIGSLVEGGIPGTDSSGVTRGLEGQLSKLQDPNYGRKEFLQQGAATAGTFDQVSTQYGAQGYSRGAISNLANPAFAQRQRQGGSQALQAFGQFRLGNEQNIGSLIGQIAQYRQGAQDNKTSFFSNLLNVGATLGASYLGGDFAKQPGTPGTAPSLGTANTGASMITSMITGGDATQAYRPNTQLQEMPGAESYGLWDTFEQWGAMKQGQ